MPREGEANLQVLARRVGDTLLARGARLVTVESCTGGWVAQTVTSISGSSQWFDRGFVTYTNVSKVELVGVDATLLETHGAVSEPVALSMARGGLACSHADVAVSVTGVAGPDGGSREKPVGTVHIAWALRDGSAHCARHLLVGDRTAIRRKTVVLALHGVCELLAGRGYSGGGAE